VEVCTNETEPDLAAREFRSQRANFCEGFAYSVLGEAKGRWRGRACLTSRGLGGGEHAVLQLADFGAEVVKIEPLEGDPLRAWRDGGAELFWKVYSRNKMSAALNLRNPAAVSALLRLVEQADVFVESYRPGTLEKMGLAPDVLMARNPNLIVVRVFGFRADRTLCRAARFRHAGRSHERARRAQRISRSGAAAAALSARRHDRRDSGADGDGHGAARGASAEAGGQVIDLSLLEPLFSDARARSGDLSAHTGKRSSAPQRQSASRLRATSIARATANSRPFRARRKRWRGACSK